MFSDPFRLVWQLFTAFDGWHSLFKTHAITIRVYMIARNYSKLNEKHERNRGISWYKVRKYIFQWKVVDSHRGTGKRCESRLKSRIDQLIPWGKLKFRLPTPSPIHCKWRIPRGTRAYIHIHASAARVYATGSNITFSPINFIATNVYD